MKILLTTLITLGSISPVFADQKAGYSEDRTCYKTEYREEYVPGTLENPGYIRTYNETVEVPVEIVVDTPEERQLSTITMIVQMER